MICSQVAQTVQTRMCILWPASDCRRTSLDRRAAQYYTASHRTCPTPTPVYAPLKLYCIVLYCPTTGKMLASRRVGMMDQEGGRDLLVMGPTGMPKDSVDIINTLRWVPRCWCLVIHNMQHAGYWMASHRRLDRQEGLTDNRMCLTIPCA